MAVQQEIKSQLAKLLATEDLVVEHRQISTAQFDVHSRVLTLPMWEKASGNVYDMLVGHEVGHALYTPDEWDWRDRIPQQFVNVVEDARIEKLMKRKYLGIAKTFYRGYTELHEQDFFEINDEDYDSFNLADRINLHYKIGTFLDISFTDAEKEIVDLIGKCETFDDALKAAEVLYQYCKKEKEEEKISLENISKKGNDDVELNSEGQTDEGKEGEEESQVDSPQTPQMEKSGSDTGEVQQDEDKFDEPEVRTADALSEKLQSLINDEGVENVYVEIPKLNLDTLIAKNSEIHELVDEYFTQEIVNHKERVTHYEGYNNSIPSDPFEETDKSFIQFKRDAQKEVNYLVKEFECRKAASSYARATTSRTGVLDTTKLHTYRYNEDIFKKITTLPDGKNHGLVFVLDWSGSMQYVLQDTLKQLYNLIWFCRKVNIPFDVYAFTNEWTRRASYDDTPRQIPKHYEEVEGLLQVEEYFNMMNILTSKTNAKTLEKQMLNIWRISECFMNRTYFRYPERMTLSGTPLNEAIISLHQIIPQFQKENRVEKTQCIILTDGEGSQIPYHKMIDDHYFKKEPWLGARSIRPGRTFLRDRKVGKTYGFQYEYYQFTDVLLNNIKDRFPTTNFIGIRVLPNRDASRFIRLYNPYGNDKLSEDWRKTRSFTIKNSGYDAYFAMSSQSLADDTEFEVNEDATKAQIKRAFVKSLKTKKLNKKVLGEFVSLVA